tara:strand:- start:3394 stop:3546 length:153 start_codon:yes stop_codon:yes gene_type:complete
MGNFKKDNTTTKERLGIFDDIDDDIDNIPTDEADEYLSEIINYCKEQLNK